MIMDVFSIPETQKSSTIALNIMRYSKKFLEKLNSAYPSDRLRAINDSMIKAKIVCIKQHLKI